MVPIKARVDGTRTYQTLEAPLISPARSLKSLKSPDTGAKTPEKEEEPKGVEPSTS